MAQTFLFVIMMLPIGQSGYVITDVTGDNFVDGTDVSIDITTLVSELVLHTHKVM